uniref:Adenomatous polyposis coli protein n=1 Tax=Steinernema glaseri TaxID=37863 RepID=A0A1I8A3M1_9BILA
MGAGNDDLGAVARRSVDERVASLLAQLNYDSLPAVEVVNESLDAVVAEEPEPARKNAFLRILPYAAGLRLQLCYLAARRKGLELEIDGHGYVNEMQAALGALVTGSYDEHYRKYAIVLGVVDTIAEALLLEVAVFDVDAPEHYAIRKLIANSLTNLTFGNFHSKQRLCRYNLLISTVTKIIAASHSLAVVFAGLIRNLSWRADEEMQAVLAETVPSIAHASVRAYFDKDQKCLQATLSALWNLSSHCARNQTAICEAPRMLEVLIRSLNSRVTNVGIVENASGIMKYISLHLAKESQRYSEVVNQYQLDKRLLTLLTSPSFTILGSVLGALQNLVAHNASLQLKIRHNAVAMNHLTKLSDSTRDDIRAAVKGVLNHLNASTVADYTFRMPRYPIQHDVGSMGNEMCSSMTASCSISHHHDSSRLLPRRNAAQHHHLLPCPLTSSTYQYHTSENANFMPYRSATLPRHFETSGQRRNEFNRQANQPPRHAQQSVEPSEAQVGECQELSDSMRATRSTSMQSLTEDVPNTSEWPSEINTTNNSSRLSPISPSEIPDSPTQCSAPSLPLSVQETPKRTIGIVNPSTSSLGKTVSDETIVPYAKAEYELTDLPLISETDSLKNLGSDSESVAKFKRIYGDEDEEEEGDYGVFEREQCDRILEDTLRDEDDEEDLLSNMIDSVMPKPRGSADDGLLLASIASAMPRAKNAKALARPATNAPGHFQSSQELLQDLQTSSLVTHPSTSERVRDAARLADDSDDNLSEDNFGPLDGVDGVVDSSLPDDVESELKAEKVLIDCASLPRPKPRGPPPQVPRKPSNLPRATAKIRVGAKTKL